MGITTVVNIRKEKCDIYIGRSKGAEMHYGNPFAISQSSVAKAKASSLKEALMCFHEWVAGSAHQEVEPERREWVVRNIETLRGKKIGCFCKPKACHGDIYRVVLGEITLDEALSPAIDAEIASHQGDLF